MQTFSHKAVVFLVDDFLIGLVDCQLRSAQTAPLPRHLSLITAPGFLFEGVTVADSATKRRLFVTIESATWRGVVRVSGGDVLEVDPERPPSGGA